VLTRVQAAVAAKAAVEMATGMLTEHGNLPPARAARALRAYTARTGGRLTETAQALVRRALDPRTVLAQPE
ncbi:ANTAR domain-containing protein, partial [Streptomyces sp. NPDC057654]|uniref:ANTAR domain-containing protein n=1 Tax=Streptomyces sp. NPDC057654 TaxID=3346196 RepID=UPI0036860D13